MKKWFLRLLVAIVIFIALTLAGLQIISGTSDTQKHGLEQAFSRIFGGSARFGKLVNFNLFPQFALSIEDLEISGVTGGVVYADAIEIVFGSEDLVLKNRQIEKFHLKKLRMPEGSVFPAAVDIEDAGIYAGDKVETGKFTFSGTFAELPLDGRLAMLRKEGFQPKYSLAEQNDFIINIGAIQVSGVYSPYTVSGGEFSRLLFLATNGKDEKRCALLENKKIPSKDFMGKVMGDFAKIRGAKDFDALCGKMQQ